MLTIGQTPRKDILSGLNSVLSQDIKIIEAGALDGISLSKIKSYETRTDDYILVTRMRNGHEIKIAKRNLLPLIQNKIHELENSGVKLTVLMCTGKFPHFESKRLVVTPSEILKGVLEGTLKKGRLGIVYPTSEQVKFMESEFGREGITLYGDWFSPYEQTNSLDSLIHRLEDQELNMVFLNCFGFNSDIRKIIAEKLNLPVIQSNTLIARVINELV